MTRYVTDNGVHAKLSLVTLSPKADTGGCNSFSPLRQVSSGDSECDLNASIKPSPLNFVHRPYLAQPFGQNKSGVLHANILHETIDIIVICTSVF